MTRPALRSDADILRTLVIAAGLSWSAIFVAVAIRYELELYADGAMFSYAVAVQDAWTFHWHNISGRLSVFLLTLLPAETYVALTGDPRAGIMIYGLLFNVAPLFGLIGTFTADRSDRRTIFVYACGSTALLCPLVFGFPTEMWLAHALFWPTLAVSHYARRGVAGAAIVFVMMLALVFTHEGALVLAFAIVMTLALRGVRDRSFLRAAGVLIAVLAIWAAVKITFPPDDYVAEVLARAALHFFDLDIFRVNLVILLLAVLGSYALTALVLSRLAPGKEHLIAVAIVAVLLAIYWTWFDHSVHAANRYYLRTVLVIVTPMLGALASVHAMLFDKSVLAAARLSRALTIPPNGLAIRILTGAFLLVMAVHAVQTAKFIPEWTHYKAAVAALATGSASDPSLGDPRLVSSERIDPDLNRLSWFSTTQYLSVIVANFMPTRLVVDPKNNYFWLSCRTATANFEATRAVPPATRDLVRVYACLHR